MQSILVSPLALILLLQPVSGLLCPLQVSGSGEVEPVALCAMCSDTHAAVRWRVIEDKTFGFLRLKYTCKDQNGSELYTEDSPGSLGDTCFKENPDRDNKTGVLSIGHTLSPGDQCEFRTLYRVDHKTTEKRQNCTIKSPEVCTANPEECQVDRVSELNEDGECQYHCAEGLAGELCNNVDECQYQTACDENAECHDTDGSYWCQCKPGFTGDGYNCTDINECKTQNDTCSDENANCVNSVGNYSCQCNPGFTGDGYNCSAISVLTECELLACDEYAECVHSDGSYQCKCTSGYDGNGHTCSASVCTQVGDVCHLENSVCMKDRTKPDIYRCSCLPGFRDVAGNCTDIDECAEDIHVCQDNTTCTNTIGSYLCMSNVNSSDENTAAVAIGGTLAAFLLLLLLPVGIISAFYQYFKCKRKKALPFQDPTKMTLDPYYMPSFWNGSFASVHSIYEKLRFSSSTTDVNCSEKCEYKAEHFKDSVSIGTAEKVSALSSLHTVEYDEGELHTPLTAGHLLTVQRNKYVQEVPTHLHACGQMTSEDNVMYASDTLASMDKNETAQDTSVTCGNSASNGELISTHCSISLQSPRKQPQSPAAELAATYHTSSGYIHEGHGAGCNLYHVTGSATTKTCDARRECGLSELDASRDPETGPSTDYTDESTVCSSGYVTASERLSDDYHRRGSCSADSHTRNRPKLSAFRYDSVSSSGYASEANTGDLYSPNTHSCDVKFKPWNSQTSLQSDDTDNTTDLGAADFVGSVKFTVNGHQEFEYVNKLEETFYNDVNFDIRP